MNDKHENEHFSKIYNIFSKICSDQLGIDEAEIRPNSDLVNDFGADELDLVELLMALEDEFNIEIPDEDITRDSLRDKGLIWRTRKRSPEPSIVGGDFKLRRVNEWVSYLVNKVQY